MNCMRNLILCISIFITTSAFGQGEFVIKANGLTPKFTFLEIEHLSQGELYDKALMWILENKQVYRLEVEDKTEDEMIRFTSIKGNAVNQDQRYFNAKYDISLSFEDGQCKFEPTVIQLKVNSKYDMGWKDFDFKDVSTYFKKGKVIRKYRSYIQDMTDRLNELNSQLSAQLNRP